MKESYRAREAVSAVSREKLRREIDRDVARFLAQGGRIDVLASPCAEPAPKANGLWRDVRGMGSITLAI